MTALISRFRGPFIALVVLVFTASVALAGGGPPPAADDGLATAAAGLSGQCFIIHSRYVKCINGNKFLTAMSRSA